jgi:hypothetical protein
MESFEALADTSLCAVGPNGFSRASLAPGKSVLDCTLSPPWRWPTKSMAVAWCATLEAAACDFVALTASLDEALVANPHVVAVRIVGRGCALKVERQDEHEPGVAKLDAAMSVVLDGCVLEQCAWEGSGSGALELRNCVLAGLRVVNFRRVLIVSLRRLPRRGAGGARVRCPTDGLQV